MTDRNALQHRAAQLAQGARWTHARVDELVAVLGELATLGGWPAIPLEARRGLGELLRQDPRQGARVLPGLLCAGRLDLSYMDLDRLPEAACELPGLTWLSLDHNQLSTLPDAIGRSLQLATLDLRGNPISRLPAALRALTALESLSLERHSAHPPLTVAPPPLFTLPALQTLSLAGHALQALPDALGDLQHLRTLLLDHNHLAALPDALGRCAALVTLRAEHNRLTALPDTLGELTRLRFLHLQGNQLAALPDALGRCAALEILDARDNRLTALPDALGDCASLHTLSLDKNALTALPDALGQLARLRFLHLRQNQLSTIPWAMRQLRALEALHLASNAALKALPDALLYLPLREASGLPGLGRQRKIAERVSFLRRLSQTKLPLDARQRVFALFETRQGERRAWLEALSVKGLRDEALAHLTASAPPPLSQAAVVAVAGKVALKRADLQRRLKEKNIRYSAKIDDKVTHVALGFDPEDPAALAACAAALVRDTWLHDALEQGRDLFLERPPSAPLALAHRENLHAMLTARDEATVHTALELLKDGGVPDDALPELLGLALLAPWPRLRRAAQDLIVLHGDPSWRAALQHKPRLIHTQPPALDRTANNFSLWQQHLPAIPMERVALMALRHRGHGLRYLFRQLPDGHPARAQALTLIRRGDALDFGAHYTDQIIHCDLPSQHPAHLRQALDFPSELLRHADLRSLSLRGALLRDVPDELGLFTDLEHLDLSLCLLRRLPDSLGELRQLRSLNLAGNQLIEPPALLARLPALTHLNITRNHQAGHALPLILPAQLRAALPNLHLLREGTWDDTTLPAPPP